ncbi:HK97-gp10 family putative phage morphogenesis protein [Bacillus sp. FSL M8-0168]|uniref:HK97-gp10 family putative phage morphogenesis protein n=1 Tax=Bacillus sp. FSL M8-0168 TaxID=2921614 RepID=UPI0030FD6346
MSVRITGLRAIEGNLRKLAAKEKKVRNKALERAAKEVADQLEINTPSGDDHGGTHMKDDVQISKPNEDGHITVGFGKETSWRVHFVEMGTMKQPPQGFIQQTEEQMQSKVLEIIRTELKRGLGL